MQYPRDQGVDSEPDGADDEHQPPLDLVMVMTADAAHDAIVRLHQDERRDRPQDEGVRQRRQDLGAMVAEGALRGGRTGGEVDGQKRETDRGRIG